MNQKFWEPWILEHLIAITPSRTNTTSIGITPDTPTFLSGLGIIYLETPQ